MNVNQLFRAITVALFFAISLGACKKEADPAPQGAITFWSKNSAVTTIKVNCYVDGNLIGTLNKTTSAKPDCSDSSLPIARVSPGLHEAEFRAETGESFKQSYDVAAGICYTAELK